LEVGAMVRKGRSHDLSTLFIRSPLCRLATVKCSHDRGCRDIAPRTDAGHTGKINPSRDRLHAECHRRSAAALIKRRLNGDVADRQVQGEIDDLQTEIMCSADLVDRCAASRSMLDPGL